MFSFLQFLNPSGVQIDIVGLCGTLLNDNVSNLYKVNNYSTFFQNKSTQSGGIRTYLHNQFQDEEISSDSFQSQHTKSLFIEI